MQLDEVTEFKNIYRACSIHIAQKTWSFEGICSSIGCIMRVI